MPIDLDRAAGLGRFLQKSRAARAGLLVSLIALGACADMTNYARDGRAINLRDCSQWATESIPGCYDGQGGGGGRN